MSKKEKVSINAGSMADIAFLLLIFFLVTTVIRTDKGLVVKLPSKEEAPVAPIAERNVLAVFINSADQIMVNGEKTSIIQLNNTAQDFIDNANRAQLTNRPARPNKTVVSIKSDKGTSYNTYIQVQNELKRAYRELRNARAHQEYGVSYLKIKERAEAGNPDAAKKIKNINNYYRRVISEAEPDLIAER